MEAENASKQILSKRIDDLEEKFQTLELTTEEQKKGIESQREELSSAKKNSLSDLQRTGQSTSPLSVKVLHVLPVREYENAQKRKMAVIEAVVADSTGCTRLTVYNRTAFSMIKEEKSLMMLDVICETNEIVAISSSTLILIPNVEIGDDVKVKAASLFNQMKNPPGPHHCTILEAMELPPGTSVTVDVKVVEVGPVQTVATSYGGETNVRNGVCGDVTGRMPFALWRNLATTPLSSGDCIHFKNAIVSKTTDGQSKLSGNQTTTVEFLTADTIEHTKGSPTYDQTGELIGLKSVHEYLSCSREQCFNKKLDNYKCPKCNTDYTDNNINKSVICTVAIQQQSEINNFTLFPTQLQQILHTEEKFTSKEQVEEAILNIVPAKVGFTKSPQKNSNTVTVIKQI